MTASASAPVLLNSDTLPEPQTATATETPAEGVKSEGQTQDNASAGGAGDTETKPQGSDAPGGEGAEGEKDTSQEGQTEPEGAPETYQFELPEGMVLDQAGHDAFTALAREDNMSNAKAQRYVDLFAKNLNAALDQARTAGNDAFQAEVDGWASQVAADAEIGGTPEQINEKLNVAKAALEKFGDKRMGELLVRFGLGNHPAFVAFAYRAGKMLQEDKSLHRGGATVSNAGKRDADVLWPNGGNGAPGQQT